MAIHVRANRQGFYGQFREVGDEFEINDKSELGSWMDIKKSNSTVAEHASDPDERQFVPESRKTAKKAVGKPASETAAAAEAALQPEPHAQLFGGDVDQVVSDKSPVSGNIADQDVI